MLRRIDRTRIQDGLTGSLGVRVRAILALGIVLGLGTVGTMALWSDSAVATSGEFKTGVVEIRVNGAENYIFTGSTFSMAGMRPGESRAATLQVQNSLSTLPVTYTAAASTAIGSPTLANYLRMTVFTGATPTNSTSNGLATGTCAGTQLGTAILRSGASVPVITVPQPLGAAAGTSDKPSSQSLCVIVALVPEAPLSVQNQTQPAITMTFSATST
ncbi:SipW-dependent-type signal peptide-containing protein [Williamsia muralis]|uniref:SipW-dependent-type signal peptide-containing protein n=1 Tax=Williamsia marianensis TaxID=85044 RepID=UPI0038068806